MIVPMQKVILVTLASEREKALEALRSLGEMHLVIEKLADSTDRAELVSGAGHVERILTYLGSLDVRKIKKGRISVDVDAVLAEVAKLLSEKETLGRDLEQANRRIEQLAKWGDFNPETIAELAQKGVYVSLCEAPVAVFQAFEAKNAAVQEISRSGDQVAFAVISREKIAPETLPLANVPQDCSLARAKADCKACTIGLSEIDAKLRVIAANDMELVKSHARSLSEKLDFLTARDAMRREGEVSVLSGFVPLDRMEEFDAAAKANAWAYIANPANEAEEAVPTLVRMPKWVGVVRPLFDFLGIVPGYSEVDASAIVLVFFTIFFGILVGDAGYGLVFALAAFPATFLTKGKSRIAAGLIALLSCSAMVWGILTNNYFGCSIAALKPLECTALASAGNKDANVQFLCFTLGLIQLSLGHFWKMLRDGRWRNVGSQLGWLAMMTANFFLIRTMIVYPGTTDYPAFMVPCYLGGILLIAVCEVVWTDPGSILGFPFSLINSFVDLLSYIRLFAVGLAGYYLAFSFNGIAQDMFAAGPGAAVGAVLILLLGHTLNIGLCVLSVLVHGVRLNTLEFSSHVGLQWGGFAFQPFAKESK